MKRLGIGMAKKYNERYKEKGSLFQGAYRAKTIVDDRYFRYVSTYVQLKNALDMYPGGNKSARKILIVHMIGHVRTRIRASEIIQGILIDQSLKRLFFPLYLPLLNTKNLREMSFWDAISPMIQKLRIGLASLFE